MESVESVVQSQSQYSVSVFNLGVKIEYFKVENLLNLRDLRANSAHNKAAAINI